MMLPTPPTARGFKSTPYVSYMNFAPAPGVCVHASVFSFLRYGFLIQVTLEI